MRLLLATDAWTPQVNGVVVSIRNTLDCLRRQGHEAMVIEPGQFRTIPCPSYPEIRLALGPARGVTRAIESFAPDAIHIATEGPLGLATRRHCVRNGIPFTTAYHTQFPRYIRARIALPLAWTYRWLRWFHGPSQAVMTATPAMREELVQQGFRNVVHWGRGVDTTLFRPGSRAPGGYPQPVFLYVGRVSVEKNIDAFLALDLPGTKVVVGDGPERVRLQREFPDAVFVGAKSGAELASHYQRADVFVFPSLTDTFGLVLAEAMACGTPVAAFPVTGPIDVVTDRRAGVLDADLRRACMAALTLDRDHVARFGSTFSWDDATRDFLFHLRQGAIPRRRNRHAGAPA
ncbi:MAG: glycosyltransferase family 1 protein [Betaproteobacteria bacterium]|nr:glycosyltransferase family 1 protein [Betaproteobacteria bacterium]